MGNHFNKLTNSKPPDFLFIDTGQENVQNRLLNVASTFKEVSWKSSNLLHNCSPELTLWDFSHSYKAVTTAKCHIFST